MKNLKKENNKNEIIQESLDSKELTVKKKYFIDLSIR